MDLLFLIIDYFIMDIAYTLMHKIPCTLMIIVILCVSIAFTVCVLLEFLLSCELDCKLFHESL